jgi:dTDP-4-amino-4,6-dideoxygalactose transaminase
LNYRLPDVLCALGISQLSRLDTFKCRRREIFKYYQESLSGLEGITLPTERDYVSSNWHLYPIQVSRERRESIYNELRASGIGVQVNYIPAYWHPVFEDQGYKRGEFPISDNFYSREISLPMHFELQNLALELIASKLKSNV